MGGVIEFVPPEPADVASPCVNVCVIDRRTGWCRGCGRTLDEIAGWRAAGAVERRAVLAKLSERIKWLVGREPTGADVVNKCCCFPEKAGTQLRDGDGVFSRSAP